MSVICQNFVQNAWRKDLCSNCFKSETDHSGSGYHGSTDRMAVRTAGRYIPQATSLYQNRSLSTNVHWRPLLGEPVSRISDRIASRDFGSQTNVIQQRRDEPEDLSAKGILKETNPEKKNRRSNVGFASEDPLVIGYGGRDYDSDDSPWELGSDDGSINMELLDQTDEDRKITKLTKNNTEFNSVNDNLTSDTNVNRLDYVKTMADNNKKSNTSFHERSTSSKDNITKAENKPESHYYFSTKNEPVKPHVPTLNEQANYLNSCKEMSIIQKDIPAIINNIQNNNKYDDSCQKLDNRNELNLLNYVASEEEKECQYKNSQKYLLITKVQDSCGSDSDYSTSKQTNGESSTDTESFHDAEESLMVPCSSFLHGSVQSESPSNLRNYSSKPFETSSVSSIDTSTSDDSDCIKSQKELNNNFKNKSNKNLAHEGEISQPVVTVGIIESNFRKSSSKSAVSDYDDVRIIKGLTSFTEISASKTKECTPDIYAGKINRLTDNVYAKGNAKESPQVTISASSQASTKAKSIDKNSSTDHNESFIHNNHLSSSVVVTSKNVARSNETDDKKGNDSKKISVSITGSEIRIPENLNSKYGTPNANQSNKKPEVSTFSAKPTGHSDTVTVNHNPAAVKKSPRASLDSQVQVLNKNDECKKWIEKNEEWKPKQHPPQQIPPIKAEFQPNNSQQDIYATESNSSSKSSSPNSRSNRESKLAALALELEKVRCDLNSMGIKETHPQIVTETPCQPTPRVRVTSKVDLNQTSTPVKSTPPSADTTVKYPSIRRGRSLISANQAPKSSLPDLLPDNNTKVKKGRFSLKKLLKRGKDSDTLIINNSNEYNPKAWKRQTFDRSRLSLEIVHPMDLTSDPATSSDTTPTDEKRNSVSLFCDPSSRRLDKGKSSAPRARSLSALPQLGSCVAEIADLRGSGLAKNDNSSLDRTRVDMPRKAGTVAERSKKYKAPRRTPSFSELSTSPTGRSPGSSAPSERPPKPPPPPRGKSLPPPQPPSVPPPPASEKTRHLLNLPARPPPPKIPGEQNLNNSSSPQSVGIKINEQLIGDYANLGDIRLNITPKKPQRPSAISFARDTLEMDEIQSPQSQVIPQSDDNTYESLEAHEEEDHYTYLDEMEIKNSSNKRAEDKEPTDKKAPVLPRTSLILKKPWMNLHASYAAIAAANYESLAELITTAISESLEQFQKSASSLRWSDFELESDDPIQILEDKIVYNAIYKSQTKTKVTLMVTTQKQHTTQNCRNTTRLPMLATFSDVLPKQYMNNGIKHPNFVDSSKAMIYVLQRSKTTTVNQFAQDSACFQTNQHVHLRNACFVLLQLIHTLKSLQAEGIEEIDYDLGRILLLHTDVDKPPILVLLPGDKVYLTKTDFYKADVAMRKTTLCQTTLQLLFHLLQIKVPTQLKTCVVNGEALAAPVAYTFEVIAKILSEEKASSLSQAKGLLEYMLWGPVDIKTVGTEEDIDVILQRWLDLQRAQMVKSLVSNLHLKISSHTGFHVYEEYQLIFLLQATVKSLKDIISKL